MCDSGIIFKDKTTISHVLEASDLNCWFWVGNLLLKLITNKIDLINFLDITCSFLHLYLLQTLSNNEDSCAEPLLLLVPFYSLQTLCTSAQLKESTSYLLVFFTIFWGIVPPSPPPPPHSKKGDDHGITVNGEVGKKLFLQINMWALRLLNEHPYLMCVEVVNWRL